MPNNRTPQVHQPAPAGTATPGVAGDTVSPARKPGTGPLVRLLVRAAAAAQLGGVSRATWHRLRAADRTPAPLRLGGAVLWRAAELAEWCAAGCPDRRTWEALQSAQQNGRPW